MNIVIFNPDEMRWDAMAHMGNPAAITPNLDKLAQTDGVSFSRAYCQNPVCTPSRCSFLTGLYPHVGGWRTINHMLPPGQSTLFSELKNAGYHVWMNARNDFLPAQVEGIFEQHADVVYEGAGRPSALENPGIRGEMGSDTFYSHYKGKLVPASGDDRVYDGDEDNVDAAIEGLRQRPKDKPFCLFLGLNAPHPDYAVEEPFFSAIDRAKLPPRAPTPDWALKPSMEKSLYEKLGVGGWAESRFDELRAVYLGMCMKVDMLFGRLCDALKAEGVYDDTAIFVLSDHGDYCGDYGLVEKNQNTFEDCLTRVPFLVKPPKSAGVQPGVNGAMVELVDLYATVMDYAGVTPDHTHFGRSLREVVAGRQTTHREAVFCEGGRLMEEKHASEANGLVGLNPATPYYPRVSSQASDGPEHTKATMVCDGRFKYVKRLYELDELYDQQADPQNLHNLIHEPQHAGVVAQMKARMLDWYQTTCDIVPFTPDSRFPPRRMLKMLMGRSEKARAFGQELLDRGLTPQEAIAEMTKNGMGFGGSL